MKIGLITPFTGKNAHPAEFARVAESLGFESLWVPEHPALPVNPKTQFPGGGEIPPVYHQMGDQIVALSGVAVFKRLSRFSRKPFTIDMIFEELSHGDSPRIRF